MYARMSVCRYVCTYVCMWVCLPLLALFLSNYVWLDLAADLFHSLTHPVCDNVPGGGEHPPQVLPAHN